MWCRELRVSNHISTVSPPRAGSSQELSGDLGLYGLGRGCEPRLDFAVRPVAPCYSRCSSGAANTVILSRNRCSKHMSVRSGRDAAMWCLDEHSRIGKPESISSRSCSSPTTMRTFQERCCANQGGQTPIERRPSAIAHETPPRSSLPSRPLP